MKKVWVTRYAIFNITNGGWFLSYHTAHQGRVVEIDWTNTPVQNFETPFHVQEILNNIAPAFLEGTYIEVREIKTVVYEYEKAVGNKED